MGNRRGRSEGAELEGKNNLLGLLGEEFSIGPLGPLRECR
jgi:hypothetical protein